MIEIEDSLAIKIRKVAKSENKSLQEFINSTLRETLNRKTSEKSDEEKLKKFAESYKKIPQTPEEYEIWQDEQVWE